VQAQCALVYVVALLGEGIDDVASAAGLLSDAPVRAWVVLAAHAADTGVLVGEALVYVLALVGHLVQDVAKAALAGALEAADVVGAGVAEGTGVRAAALVDVDAELLGEVFFEADWAFADWAVEGVLADLAAWAEVAVATVVVCLGNLDVVGV
jgi:hypothetical protein